MRTVERLRCRILKGNDEVFEKLAADRGLTRSDFLVLICSNNIVFIDGNLLNYLKYKNIKTPFNGDQNKFPRVIVKTIDNTTLFSIYVPNGTIDKLLQKASDLRLNSKGAIGLFIDRLCCYPILVIGKPKGLNTKLTKSKLRKKKK